jgi:hypothetical protein
MKKNIVSLLSALFVALAAVSALPACPGGEGEGEGEGE